MFTSITNYQTFIDNLRIAGFSMSGGNNEGIFTLADYYSEGIVEHTGEVQTDPWAWRMLSIRENKDLFYGKIFLNKGGFITANWYPYLYVIRRNHKEFEQFYEDGHMSYESKRVYELVKQHPHIALHEITSEISDDKSSKARAEAAITQLQMKLFISISGEKSKLSKEGKPFGWPVTTFVCVDEFVDPQILEKAKAISLDEAVEKMTERILELNPKATSKAIKKFLNI